MLQTDFKVNKTMDHVAIAARIKEIRHIQSKEFISADDRQEATLTTPLQRKKNTIYLAWHLPSGTYLRTILVRDSRLDLTALELNLHPAAEGRNQSSSCREHRWRHSGSRWQGSASRARE